ncbi:hypothetical protein [Fumia xinanensis]|uniref:Uncharacterized protein n=1 Tax=Fumia xinanensis TaxID=2763659 RepID=A0A926E377_9FIRM|nr:hypothetical protein [Fumia xinanensis]MBC8558723.1 hypothetical protein [Fumia xinanensis]
MFGKRKKEEKVQEVDMVCPRCGWVDSDLPKENCPFCGYSPVVIVGPAKVFYCDTMEDTLSMGEELRTTYCPTNSPAYDAEWAAKYQKRIQEYLIELDQKEKEQQKQEEIQKELEWQEKMQKIEKSVKDSRYIPKCPTCGSPDIRKAPEIGISTVYESGLVSIYDCVRKQFECNNCGYQW